MQPQFFSPVMENEPGDWQAIPASATLLREYPHYAVPILS